MCFINSQYVINMHANKQLVKRIIDPYTEVLPKFLGIQHISTLFLKQLGVVCVSACLWSP